MKTGERQKDRLEEWGCVVERREVRKRISRGCNSEDKVLGIVCPRMGHAKPIAIYKEN